MEKKIKTVAIYVRKSRDDKESLESQLSTLLEFCEGQNWEYETFKEQGSASSEDFDRPELQRMLKLVQSFHFDAVVSTEQSRISRKQGHWETFSEIMKEVDCLFITPQNVYDFSKPEDEFVSSIMSVLAKQELTQTKARLKRGTVQSAKKGNWLGKKTPVGYKYNPETKRLEPSEDAPIIKRMFEDYKKGLSTKEIAIKYTHENVMTSVSLQWSPAGVSRLLNNIVYAGHSLYGRTTQKKVNGKRKTERTEDEKQILVKNTHEPIVSQELFDEVQQIKENRNSRPPALRLGKHKFSGLIRCSTCGAIHSFQTAREKKRISSCQTRQYNKEMTSYTVCSNKGANVSEFEKLFYTYFETYVNKLEEHLKLIQPVKNETNNEDEISQKERQLKKLQQQIKKVQQGFILEVFSETEAQQQIKQLKGQIKTLEEQLKQLEKRENFSEYDYLTSTLDKMKRFLTGTDEMNEREQNEILSEFIETIIYSKDDNGMNLKIVMK